MNLEDPQKRTSQLEEREKTERAIDDLLLVDGTEEFQSRFEFSFWVVGLDDGGNHCDVNILGANVVSR